MTEILSIISGHEVGWFGHVTRISCQKALRSRDREIERELAVAWGGHQVHCLCLITSCINLYLNVKSRAVSKAMISTAAIEALKAKPSPFVQRKGQDVPVAMTILLSIEMLLICYRMLHFSFLYNQLPVDNKMNEAEKEKMNGVT